MFETLGSGHLFQCSTVTKSILVTQYVPTCVVALGVCVGGVEVWALNS